MGVSARVLMLVAGLNLIGTAAFAEPVDPVVSRVTVTVDPKFVSGGVKTYGTKEVGQLADYLKKTVERNLLAKDRFKADAVGGAVLELVLVDAKPNHPTFKQMSDRPGLSMQSFGIGGAEIRGEQINADGGRVKLGYSWYESDIRWAQAQGTWGDAEQAIHGFARRVAEGHADIPTK
jgi:hypothetical protein